ncbi:hypothetical protein GCM10017687_33020 [Streptomyces echinatus]|uniref:hypothetical protein n=1 Tax=Streptomyces echinatus TaxID=67293 RepID=UPI0031EC201F
MTTRDLRFGLYADEEGLALVEGIVRRAVEPRSARILRWSVARTVVDGGLTTAYLYDHLAEQWAVENPGRAGGARRPVELHVRAGVFPADLARDPQDGHQGPVSRGHGPAHLPCPLERVVT